MSIGVELFGSMPCPENKGFDVEVERTLGRKRRRRRMRRVEWMVMMVEERARPSEGEEAEISVVEAGDDWQRPYFFLGQVL